MGTFLQWLLRVIGLKRVKRRYHVDLHTAEYLESLALEQSRDPEQIVREILAEGIDKRMQVDRSFEAWELLSAREREVVALICLGYTYKEIGKKLTISPETVKSHVRNVLQKLALKNRGEIQRLLLDWDFRDWDR